MIKTVIIEDEKPASRQLEKIARLNGLEVMAVIHSVSEGKKWFQENLEPDLIISDIQLGDGLSFEIYEELNLKSFILFTTAYNQYALRAFKLNSIDYLLKPIDKKAFEQAIIKYKQYQQPFYFDKLKELFKEEKIIKERFVITIGSQLKVIYSKDIQAFSSENKATYLHTNNRRYLIEESLEDLEKVLNKTRFFRINRQYIVELNSILRIVSFTNSRLKIILKSVEGELIVSRERVKYFKNWLNGN